MLSFLPDKNLLYINSRLYLKSLFAKEVPCIQWERNYFSSATSCVPGKFVPESWVNWSPFFWLVFSSLKQTPTNKQNSKELQSLVFKKRPHFLKRPHFYFKMSHSTGFPSLLHLQPPKVGMEKANRFSSHQDSNILWRSSWPKIKLLPPNVQGVKTAPLQLAERVLQVPELLPGSLLSCGCRQLGLAAKGARLVGWLKGPAWRALGWEGGKELSSKGDHILWLAKEQQL